MPESLLATATATLLVSVAVPVYNNFANEAYTSKAISDIGRISLQIERYRTNGKDELPASLAEINLSQLLDPWDNPYVYRVMVNTPDSEHSRKGAAGARLNSDYDLYSLGKDGRSEILINAEESRDDIVRAHDGAFVGRVSELDSAD